MTRPLRPMTSRPAPTTYPVMRQHWRTQGALWAVATAAIAAAAACFPMAGDMPMPDWGYEVETHEGVCAESRVGLEQEDVVSSVCTGTWDGETITVLTSEAELQALAPCDDPTQADMLSSMLRYAEDGTEIDFQTESVLVTIHGVTDSGGIALSSTEHFIYLSDNEVRVHIDAVNIGGTCPDSYAPQSELLVTLSIVPNDVTITDCTREGLTCDQSDWLEPR